MALSWQIHADGSFDLVTPSVRLAACWPVLDFAPVRTGKVAMRPFDEGGEVEYRLAEGVLTLRLGREGDALTLRAWLRGVAVAPHWVRPLAGRVEGAGRLFRTGLGFSGPSGFVSLADRAPWAWESHAVTAIEGDAARGGAAGGGAGTLAVSALDQSRFLHKCWAHNRLERSGLTGRHVDESPAFFEAGFATECIPLPARELELPPLLFVWRTDTYEALREATERVGAAMGARTEAPPRYHFCSWYYHASQFSEALLEEHLEGFARLQPPVPLQTVQIDDGYCPSRGDWLEPNALWPGGMERAFAMIRDAGYAPGIWVGPFMVGSASRVAAEHPDWLLRDRDGALLTPWRHYGEGRRDMEHYVLDSSHPEAFEYLRRVFRTMRAWGARFFKTDFMDWGLRDSAYVQRHTPGKTSVEYLRELLAMIREEIGEDAYWLACIAPYGPFIGYADGMRIANDMSPVWAEGSQGNCIQESVACQHFNNVWWQNDPDAIYLRDFHTMLAEQEVRTLAFWVGALGGSVNTSDPLHRLPEGRLRLWRFLQPSAERWTARLPYFGAERKLRVAVRRYEEQRAWAVVAMNPTSEPVTDRLEVRDLTGRERAYVYRWGPEGAELLGDWSHLTPQLAPHGSDLYYLAEDEAPPPAGLTLGGFAGDA